jgi:hypothetical protein
MRRSLGIAGVSLLGLLMTLPVTSVAQLTSIPEVPISGDGQVNFGYVGGTGSDILNSTATSSVFVGGSGNFTGYYEDPRILKFNITPNMTWNQYGGSLATATGENNEGVLSNFSFFTGGAMRANFQQSFYRTSTATVIGGEMPVTAGAIGHNTNYAVGWGLQKIGLPNLGLNYSWGSSDSSITGVQGPNMTGVHNDLTANVNYMLAKFQLTGMYFDGSSHQQTPDLLNLGIPEKSSSRQSGVIGELRRNLAKNTSFDARVEHNDNGYNFFGAPENTKFDTGSAYFTSSPMQRMSVSMSASYSSDATAEALAQALSPTQPTSGGGLSQNVLAVGRTLAYSGGTSYELGRGFYLQGTGTDQTSDLPGQEQVLTEQGSVGLYYTHSLWKGTFSGSYAPGILDVRLQIPPYEVSSRALTQVSTLAYSRRVGRWANQGTVSYVHSGIGATAFLPIVAESFVGNLRTATTFRRHWRTSLWASVSKNMIPGSNGTLGEIFSAQLSNHSWSASVQEEINNGYSLVSALGVSSINPVEGAAGVLPQTFYTNSNGLSLTGTYNLRRLSVSSVFTRVGVDLSTRPTPTDLGNKNWDTRMVYRFRKINIQAGYRFWSQNASNNTSLNQHSQAYWFEIVRPFHIF